MNQPFARSEDAASNDTYYCPYSNPDQAPPNPIKTLPTPKSSQGSTHSISLIPYIENSMDINRMIKFQFQTLQTRSMHHL